MTKYNTRPTVLIVDDAPENIDVLTASLDAEYEIKAAINGPRALQIANSKPAPDLILLDIMMPEMDGYEVLRKLKMSAHTKDIPVIFVTSKEEVADEARGFRLGAVDYITKPVQPLLVMARVKTHVQLGQARREVQNLLDKTLTGLISLLIDLLSLSNPSAFSRATRLKRHMQTMEKRLGIKENWQLNVAALLSQVGCITLETKSLQKLYEGQKVTKKEMEAFQNHPQVGYKFLQKIPYLTTVAEIIAQQHKPFEDITPGSSGVKINDIDEVSLGATLLKVAINIDELTARGKSLSEAFRTAGGKIQQFDTDLASSLSQISAECAIHKGVKVAELHSGLILEQDVYTENDLLLIKGGSELTMPILERMLVYHRNVGIKEPVYVTSPM